MVTIKSRNIIKHAYTYDHVNPQVHPNNESMTSMKRKAWVGLYVYHPAALQVVTVYVITVYVSYYDTSCIMAKVYAMGLLTV